MTSMMTQAEHKEHALQNKTIEPAEDLPMPATTTLPSKTPTMPTELNNIECLATRKLDLWTVQQAVKGCKGRATKAMLTICWRTAHAGADGNPADASTCPTFSVPAINTWANVVQKAGLGFREQDKYRRQTTTTRQAREASLKAELLGFDFAHYSPSRLRALATVTPSSSL